MVEASPPQKQDTPAAVRAAIRARLCPHGKRHFECWSCSPPTAEELWLDFLEQYPNQRNEILRAGPAAFGWPEDMS